MSIDGIMLAAIRKDLLNKICGGRIDKIYQPEAALLTFTLRKDNRNITLLLSANPRYPRIHLTEQEFTNPIKPPDFCMLLRKYLIRGIISRIEQPDFERILNIEIKLAGNNYNLLIEIMGKHSNIILLNQAGTILDAVKRITAGHSRERQLYPGIPYKYPPRQDKLNPLLVNQVKFFNKIPAIFEQAADQAIMHNFRGIGPQLAREIIVRAGLNPATGYSQLTDSDKQRIWASFQAIFHLVKQDNFQPALGTDQAGNIIYISAFPLQSKGKARVLSFAETGKLFDYYFQHKIYPNILNKDKNSLIKTVANYLKKNQQQQVKHKERLAEAHKADQYKRVGELITSNIYRLEKRTKQVELVDYFDPAQKKITITLDPRLTPAENAQKIFKKYNKAKKSIKYLKRKLGQLDHEERYLEQLFHNIEQSEVKRELAEIKAELVDEGYIRAKKQGKSKGKQEAPLPPLQFRSSDGFVILVGRNNRQNDNLTKKIAAKNDIWLHSKDLAGSHVIIRNKGDEVPLKTLEEAAIIAAYFSKGKRSENVAIDYTRVKNVRKAKGAKPGLVYYQNYRTIYAKPDQPTIEKLKE